MLIMHWNQKSIAWPSTQVILSLGQPSTFDLKAK